MASTHSVAKEEKRTTVSRIFLAKISPKYGLDPTRLICRRSIAKGMSRRNYNAFLVRFETSKTCKIRTTNLDQNFWHSWGRHFLRTECSYVESCKLQVGWFWVHTSLLFLKTWHDRTYIAFFRMPTVLWIQRLVPICIWVLISEHHGTHRSKVYQDNKNHFPHANYSPRQSCPTLCDTFNSITSPLQTLLIGIKLKPDVSHYAALAILQGNRG